MSKKKANDFYSNTIKVSVVILALIFVFSAGMYFLKQWESKNSNFSEISDEESNILKYKGKEYTPKQNLDSFLVLGLDSFEETDSLESYSNDKQADFLMLFVFDNDSKTCSAIQINRDTMANVNALDIAGNPISTHKKQIALAHTYGNGKEVSCRNTKDAVSDLLNDVKIDHYISFTMNSIATVNDFVGGVEVTVLDDFTGIDDSLVKGDKVTLFGEQAIRYVRTRYGLEDSTNNNRMKRQQQYIAALYDKTISCIEADDSFLIKLVDKMDEHIVYDTTDSRLNEYMERFKDYTFTGIRNIDGETKLGEKYMEFYPDESSVMNVVIDCFYNENK